MKATRQFVGITVLLGIAAVSILVLRPNVAEVLSQYIVSAGFVLAVLGLVVASCIAQAGLRSLFITATVSLLVFGGIITGGMTLYPLETRNGADVHPGQQPAPPNALIELLRHPWSSGDIRHVPVAPLLVRCAQVAYENPNQLKTRIRELGFADHGDFVKGSTRGVVMMVGTEAVVAFQGTDGDGDIGDWFTNLDKKLAHPPDDPVHSGFLGAYRLVAEQVREILDDNGITHVWITGHSLGGAMAVLCALDFNSSGRVNVRGVITFGQPLLLEPKFARSANAQLHGRFLRVIHKDDVVPCVVPGLRGGGSYAWFRKDGTKFGDPLMSLFGGPNGHDFPIDEDEEEGPPRLSDRQFQREKAKVQKGLAPPQKGKPDLAQGLPNATDHAMDRYVEAVTEYFGPTRSRAVNLP